MKGERLSAAAIGVAVFLAGGALLSLEIASSRVMAPYFGNSLFVWGALIGVVLAGLSVGYWVGGIIADRWATTPVFVGVLVLSALLVLAIPFVDEWILDQVVAWNPGPRMNPVVATIAIFGPPSVVLGTVSPIAVKLLARSLERLGRTAGRLFAVSTAGSIAGTFATAFFLIPELGTDQLIATLAVVLLLAAAAVAIVERLFVAAVASLAVAAASFAAVLSLAPIRAAIVAASQLQNWSPVYRQRAAEDRSGGPAEGQRATSFATPRTASTTGSPSSTTRTAGISASTAPSRAACTWTIPSGRASSTPTTSTSGWRTSRTRATCSSSASAAARGRSACGATSPRCGSTPSSSTPTWSTSPTASSSSRGTQRLNVEVEDGRRFLVQNEGPWDAIVVDAFYSDSIPFHLATNEFLELARSRLAPGGVVVTNIIGATRGSESRLLRSMLRTYRTVFPTVAVHPVRVEGDQNLSGVRNVIFVAGEGAAPSKEFLTERGTTSPEPGPGART